MGGWKKEFACRLLSPTLPFSQSSLLRASSVSPCLRVNRRGWTLLTLVTSFFVSALVLGTCVPLYLAGQREAEIGMRNARMREVGREISSHFREDVRQAGQVAVDTGGRGLRLALPRPGGGTDRVLYQSGAEGLIREVLPGGSGRAAERAVYGTPLRSVRFRQSGPRVAAELDLGQEYRGRTLELRLECSAVPRSAR